VVEDLSVNIMIAIFFGLLLALLYGIRRVIMLEQRILSLESTITQAMKKGKRR
jgi:hypothetical protein